MQFKDFKDSQRHDNKLATFVIGLADLTIINVYGETPGELTDILQTSVHAFIRMKNVDLELRYHFVHQNVTAVMADSKSKIGRQHFQDRLDLMTISATKIEKCEGRFRCFQDVIQFNEDTNVTLFPCLWKGDPPMAPVNPGYTSKACSLKEAILTTVKGKQDFASFQLRVETLWSAVLQEKFVFSFKNTLEITAYNELDIKYSQWCWKLQRELLQWKHAAKNPFSICDVSESAFNTVEKTCLLEVEQNLSNMHKELSKELVEFFEKSERSETLTQWRKNTEVRLKNLCDEYKDEAKKHCKVLRQNREGRVKADNIEQSYLQQLQAEILCLASDTKNSASTDEKKREEIFNSQWEQWIAELSKNIKPVAYATEHHMEFEITTVLDNVHYAHGHLIVEGLKLKPLTKRDSLKLDVVHLHLNSTKMLNQFVKTFTNTAKTVTGVGGHKRYHDVSEEDYCKARKQTQDFFKQVEDWVQEIMESCQDFNKSSVANLLINLQKSINEFNIGKFKGKVVKSNFTFTSHYQVDMAIIVAGYAYHKFVEKVRKLAIENDPVESMKQLKPVFLRTFETQFSKASNDQTAAQNLCSVLRMSIENTLIEKLQIEIVNNMKDEGGSHYSKKQYFKVLIMKDLAAKKNFTFMTFTLQILVKALNTRQKSMSNGTVK